jgi:aryl-alcohol dehydrogenase-like predicted oxidoreductase
VSQVALAWLLAYCRDTVVAIPGASMPHHAEEAVGAPKVALSIEETARFGDLSTAVTR